MSELSQVEPIPVNPSSRVVKSKQLLYTSLLRMCISAAVIIGLWQAVVIIFEMPSFILPSPFAVFERLIAPYHWNWHHWT